jgi:hypothetical protein
VVIISVTGTDEGFGRTLFKGVFIRPRSIVSGHGGFLDVLMIVIINAIYNFLKIFG